MKLSARMQKKRDLLIRLYRETKTSAFAVFFAACQGTDRTWAMMKKLYMRLVELAARRGGESLTPQDVLAHALRMAKKAGHDDRITFGDRISVEEAALTNLFFKEGTAQARIALLVGKTNAEGSLLSPEDIAAGRALAARLPEGAPATLWEVVKNQSDEREILGDIEFRADKRYGKSHIARVALACAVGLAAAWFVFRQAQTGVFLIAAARYEADGQVITLEADAPYPAPDAVEFSEEAPNIARQVIEKIDACGDDRQYRIDFLYYDRELTGQITIDGMTVFDLYRSAYAEAAEYGRIHKLIVNAVAAYYESYEIPYLPHMRESDFRAPYEGLYECACWYANTYASESSGFGALWEKRTDIFGDRDRFWSYIGSELFKRECSPLLRLLAAEYRIEEAAGEESAALRETYEELLFAYFNAETGAVNFKPLAVALPQENGARYTALLGEFGKRIAEEQRQAAAARFGDHGLTAADAAYEDAAAFSAVFTGAEIRALAQDACVTVIGIAFPEVPAVYPGSMDARLAFAITYSAEKDFAVYRVDAQPWVFYTNYLIPRRLPRGLIEELRKTFHSQNTAYETILGYDYEVLYGHADRLTRRELFAKLSEGSNCRYISAENRTYATIIPMP